MIYILPILASNLPGILIIKAEQAVNIAKYVKLHTCFISPLGQH